MAYKTIHEIQTAGTRGCGAPLPRVLPGAVLAAARSPGGRAAFAELNDAFPRALADGRLNFLGLNVSVSGGSENAGLLRAELLHADLVGNSRRPGGKISMPGGFIPKDAEVSETGFIANTPPGFYDAIQWANQSKLPLIISENGIEDSTDSLRPRYLVEHLHQVWRALNGNWPMKGYFHWSLVDNFEWERGWSQRFGCGVWIPVPRRASAGQVWICTRRSARKMRFRMKWWRSTRPGRWRSYFPG
jgi:beta-glucosidase